MAILINGNGNRAIYAAQDADLIASLAGNVTCIANVGNKYAATIEDANTIGLADGVIITKEGRRIQLDAGDMDLFAIPIGSSGVTNYYIIGYKLVQQADSSQVAQTFVQKMSSSSATITEDTLRGGATEVYVSLYRVTQVEFSISAVDRLLPELLDINDLSTEIISTATDFNTLTSKDKYFIIVGGCPNSPTPNNGGQLFVANPNNNDGTIRQFFVSDTGRIFIRYGSGSSWTDWKENYVKKSGDTIIGHMHMDNSSSESPRLYFETTSGNNYICNEGNGNLRFRGSDGLLAVLSNNSLIINSSPNLVYSRRISDNTSLSWKDAPDHAVTTYYYEGADTTTLDLPDANCFLTVQKFNSGRGIAMAYCWPNGANGKWWINNLHNTWGGWRQMPM